MPNPLPNGNTPCYCDSAYHPQGHAPVTYSGPTR